MVFALLLLAGAGSALALDPRVPLSQYGHRSWTAEDGLPTTAVLAIDQTPDGYIWIGTQDGLSRFDGVRFKTVKKELWVFDLTVDTRGTLWIASDFGLFAARGLDLVRVKEFDATENIFSVEAASDGSVWIGGSTRVVRRSPNGSLRVWTGKDGLPDAAVRALLPDSSGGAWVGTEKGLARISGDRVTRIGADEGMPEVAVRSFGSDASGRVWIGTTQGVRYFQGGRARIHPALGDIATLFVSAIIEDAHHSVWFATSSGVKRLLSDGTSSPVSKAGNAAMTSALFEDRTQILWVGTFRTLEQLRDTLFLNHGSAQGLREEALSAIVQDRDGSMWLGSFEGLGHLSNGTMRWLLRKDGLPNERILSLAPARSGGVWAGTFGGGVCHVNERVSRCWGVAEGLSHGMVTALVEDAGGLWIGTMGGGINYLRDGRITTPGENTGLASPRIATLIKANGGGVWVGSIGSGISLLRNGRVERHISTETAVRALLEDADGSLWVGDEERGLTFVRGHQSFTFPLGTWVDPIRVHALLDDASGGLWVVTAHRILRFRKAELVRYATGIVRELHPMVFGVEDGMASPGFSNGGIATQARDGAIWFGTKRGAARIDPAALANRKTTPPVVVMEPPLLQGGALPIDGATIHGPGERVTFQYTAIDFGAPELVQFRYKLEGYDKNWINAGTARTAVYANLPPGEFTFRVIAAKPYGEWNVASGAAIRVERTPAFRETLAFRLGCAALVGLLIMLVVRARFAALKQREVILVQRVDEKTVQLRDANAQLVEAKRRAEEADHHKHLILNSTTDGIVELDEQGAVKFANFAAAGIFGASPADLNGVMLHEFAHEAKASRSDAEDGASVARRENLSTILHSSNGRIVPVDYTITPTFGEAHDASVVVTFHDVTERRAIEKMKNEFVSTVSHELRTPLTSIRGALGILGSGLVGDVGSRAQRMVEIAIRNTDRLARLVNDILDLERLDSGSVELTRVTVDAFQLMTQTAEGIQAMADQARVHIVLEPGTQLVSVDSDRIIQTLTNLVGNAIKFSPPEGRVTLSGEASGDTFTFKVADEGRGIPVEKLASIFERFKQVDVSDARDKGGSGLGLAICYSIVKSHGGQIWAESDGTHGSLFQFTIPLAASLQESSPADQEAELLSFTSSSVNPYSGGVSIPSIERYK